MTEHQDANAHRRPHAHRAAPPRAGRGGPRRRRRPQGDLPRRPLQRPPRAPRHLGPARPARSSSSSGCAPIREAGRPGRLRGRADRLRPGPPPPGRGLPGRGHRPLEAARPGRPGGQERPPRLPPAGQLSPRRACCTRSASPPSRRRPTARCCGSASSWSARPARSSSRSRLPAAARHRRAGRAWPTGRRRPSTALRGLELAAGAAVLPGRAARRAGARPGAGRAGDRAAGGAGARPSGTARRSAVLRTVPGVGLITAMTFRLELPEPERFDHDGQVARMVGLAPQVRQSGETRREGGLLKSGNARLRTVLVEAAWRWVACDEAAARRYRRLVAQHRQRQEGDRGDGAAPGGAAVAAERPRRALPGRRVSDRRDATRCRMSPSGESSGESSGPGPRGPASGADRGYAAAGRDPRR